ncbi:pentapeptide repeat-containing protein [Methylococcus capsulatus]|uniref:pentapeptide repeat-containing protein n=2 Tax=Methylococcus TaxID=413 RepID=UPI001E4AC3DF|nr:pentapeptide repeat-containing protein [Methylococcus sp. BF19-07]MDF9391106.1 hypothetical protein [Methylococcus capsulatus]
MPTPPVGRLEPNARCNCADLSGRNLSKANPTGAELERANLAGSRLTGEIFCRTRMPDGSANNANCPVQ